MNKLQEIIEQSYVRIYNGDYDKNYEDTVKETIKDACVEYARSKVPKERETTFSSYDLIVNAENRVIKEIDNSINQDIQSLND